MEKFLAARQKLISLYQRVDFVIRPLVRFLIAFLALTATKNLIGYHATLSSLPVVFVLSVIIAVLPAGIGYGIFTIYAAAQSYFASYLLAITVLLFAFIIYCFFMRFAGKMADAVWGMPVLMGMNMPYVLPISFGLLSSPLSIIPTCSGVFAYYFIKGIKESAESLKTAEDSDNQFQLFIDVVDKVMKNKAMFAVMIVFAVVILVVYFVRSLKIDFAFEIATGVGCAVNIVGFIVVILKYDLGTGLLLTCLSSIVCGALAWVICYVYRPLSYAGSEKVQFEDEEYYYYVKAVPKLKAMGLNDDPFKKKKVKKMDGVKRAVNTTERNNINRNSRSLDGRRTPERDLAARAAAQRRAEPTTKQEVRRSNPQTSQATRSAASAKQVVKTDARTNEAIKRPVSQAKKPTGDAAKKPEAKDKE